MPPKHLIHCRPLLFLPSIFPSIRVFSNKSALHIRWPKYWSFSFSISPSNEYSALISFRMDWLDLLAVQGTLKSLLQHHNSKAILWHSAFFIVQLSHAYMTTGKIASLDLLKEKIGFLDISSMQRDYTKTAYVATLFLSGFHSQDNKLQPKPTFRSTLTSLTRDSAPKR